MTVAVSPREKGTKLRLFPSHGDERVRLKRLARNPERRGALTHGASAAHATAPGGARHRRHAEGIFCLCRM